MNKRILKTKKTHQVENAPRLVVVHQGDEDFETLICPDCGGNVTEQYVSDSVDYHREAECKDCGNFWSE